MVHGRQFSTHETLPFFGVPGDERPVRLESLDVKVVVTGLYAETTQTMRFYNPNRRDLEGNLTFPLPDGAVVCGYALDVEGKLVDGVVVPKQEARRILEAEERKGIDPGLVEHVQGNVYRTRIYPMPARASRTVRVTYTSDLTVSHDDAAYHLPLTHAQDIDEVSLRVEVEQAPVVPEIRGGIGNLSLNQWSERWVAEAKLPRGAPTEDLQVKLPSLPDHVRVVEDFEGETYFAVSSRLPAGAQADFRPARIGLVWDASGSRDDVERELELLRALLAHWPRVIVDVVLVRDVVEAEPKTFRVAEGEAEALLEHLASSPRDGGTDLGALDLSGEGVQGWLLFSDGLTTVGVGRPELGARPVFAVSGQAAANAAFLGHIAQQTGGAHLNLLRMRPREAAAAIAGWRGPLRLGDAAGAEDVHVSCAGGRFVVTGRLVESIGSVRLEGTDAPADQVSVARSQAQPGHAVTRAWAGHHAQALAVTGEHADRVVELGRKFGLVTPGTSLLVLESLEQYLEYGIEPPASQPRLREAFHAQRESTAKEQAKSREAHIERVVQLWDKRVEWWSRDFSEAAKSGLQAKLRARTPDAPPGVASRRGELSPSDVGGVDAVAMEAPALMAAPEPMMEMDAFDDDMVLMCGAEPADPALGAAMGGAGALPEDRAPAPSAAGRIQIQAWSPDAPYLTPMKRAAEPEVYAAYLEQRPQYAASPAFYFDCADHLLDRGARRLGLRVLSNILELALGDAALLRMYAYRLQQADELDAAIAVFERVQADREDEPQSHRDLALALALRWERDRRPEDATRALDLLFTVIEREWDRFPEIEVIALMEMNRLVHLARPAGVEIPGRIDERLIGHLDLDLRISMAWDADNTDVDLHVFEPDGGHAYYGNNLTTMGGLVSRDFTQGYGPEEYVLRRAVPGTYQIKAHYYASHQQTISGACTVLVYVFTNYGREDESRQVLTLRLDEAGAQVPVGEVVIEGPVRSEDEAIAWRERFAALEPGMTLDAITAAVGQPEEIRGTSQTLLVYRPAASIEVHITCDPTLESVQQILPGATVDLI